LLSADLQIPAQFTQIGEKQLLQQADGGQPEKRDGLPGFDLPDASPMKGSSIKESGVHNCICQNALLTPSYDVDRRFQSRT